MRDAHVVARANDFVAGFEAWISGRDNGARGVDAAGKGILPYDLAASACSRERVFVIDAGISGLEYDVARGELIDAHLDDAARDRVVVVVDAVRLERFHFRPRLYDPPI